MQDFVSEFSKIFWRWYPRTLTAGGGDPLPHPTLSPAGRKCPGVGTQTLVALNFSAVVAPLAVEYCLALMTDKFCNNVLLLLRVRCVFCSSHQQSALL